MTNNYADINGTRFYYEMAGKGQPLVLVHAAIADGRMWDEQFHVFAQRYQVIRYDRRGFGRTPMAAGTYSHHQDLVDLLKFLNIERASFVGCSQGARIVVDLTLEHPEMTQTIVLVSPSLSGFTFSGEQPRQAAQIDQAEEAGDIAQVNELELQIWVDGPHRTPEQVNPAVRERVREMNLITLQTPADLGTEQPLTPPAADRLGEIRTPAMVIVGDLDTPRTLATADHLARNIAGAQKWIISGTAHMPNMEKPAEFSQLVLSFLSSQA